MRRLQVLLIGALVLSMIGCSASTSVKTFEGTEPRLRPEEFFDDPVEGWGFTESRWGGLNRWFQVNFRSEVQDDTYIWHETLRYANDRVEKRKWKIVPRGNHRYDLLPTEAISEGTGSAYGKATRWNYYLDVKRYGTEWTLWVDDWMYKLNDRTMIVRATLYKYGLTVGYGYMYLKKSDP